MYLKSLTLKGFKSFADRTVMKFEPGVAAIVGPNGSGKSNISDAVLWVLGERNAKNLRGQSMEDVIFAGSSARKPVSVAEVELLLDNSDGTLPVDFAEVSIGRRMYRSGESEYLINGTIVRRMDVLDVLHDSGLGTGTNSIISQGNLDSVLASRPEDRRALIEEAAGILKHKERKAKSERKLAQMDAHLDRVNDIVIEVSRQLKPLERKARKARTYEGLAAELAELRLGLAVDDLRALQSRWDALVVSEADLVAQHDELKFRLDEAESALDALQRQLTQRTSREGSLNERMRRAQAAVERLGSTVMLVRERHDGFRAEEERLARYVVESRERAAAAQRELAGLRDAAAEAKANDEKAAAELAAADEEHHARVRERNELRRRVDTLLAEQRALAHKRETLQATQDALRKNLSEKRARAQVIDAHVADAAKRLEAACAQRDALAAEAARAEAGFSDARVEEAQSRSVLNELVVSRDAARSALDSARGDLAQASAERAALEELERAADAANPLLAEVLGRPGAALLSHVVSAPSEYDAIVEALLGSDVHALLVDDERAAEGLLDAVRAGGATGMLSVLPGGGESPAALDSNAPTSGRAPLGCTHLLDLVRVRQGYRAHIEALLADAWVAPTLAEALAARRAGARSCRIATLDGCIVWPSGKITFTRLSEADRENGALARRRALEAARAHEAQCQHAYGEAQAHDTAQEAALRDAQARSLRLAEALANLKGGAEAARRDADQAKNTADNLREEHERLLSEQADNRAFLEKAQPDSDALERDLAQAIASLDANEEQVSKLQEQLNPLQRQIVQLSERLSNARLEAARMAERLSYAQRMVNAREQEIASSMRQDDSSQRRAAVARGAAARAGALASTLGALADAAQLLMLRLEGQSRSEQERSRGLHDQMAAATQESRAARERYEAMANRLSEVRIEKGRLEVQVEAGIKVITDDLGTPLETALAHEPLDDRGQAESQAASLTRRIKNLGAINPDAAQEFDEVNERYQYLTAQLEDMRLARRALSRIVGIIDERMRDDFIATFNQVNDNFSQIFATLFPGGRAHLSLVDPDDPENAGVDVNAQPIGKRVKKMSLLSGGEKSMTALALLFAVYRTRQTPFYILDEVEAALDDTNLRRLIAYLNVIRSQTQFIMITHQRRTMEAADILYGVSMQADGITKVISQKLDNATRKEG